MNSSPSRHYSLSPKNGMQSDKPPHLLLKQFCIVERKKTAVRSRTIPVLLFCLDWYSLFIGLRHNDRTVRWGGWGGKRKRLCLHLARLHRRRPASFPTRPLEAVKLRRREKPWPARHFLPPSVGSSNRARGLLGAGAVYNLDLHPFLMGSN